MAIDWTAERIAKLCDTDLKGLHKNASGKNEAIFQLCNRELEIRKAQPNSLLNKKSRSSNLGRSKTKEFEFESDAQLYDLAVELSKTYDFSKETAKANSVGIKGFRAHNLLQKNGKNSKVYGLVQQGKLSVGNYIDYKIRNDIVHIAAILSKADDATPQYLVRGPESLIGQMEDRFPELELAPAKWFANFSEAADCFKSIVEKVVPKL